MDMPIPPFNEIGLLPEGIFDCTLSETRTRFGSFQQTDQRPRLFLRLEELFEAMQRSGLFQFLIVDGSFVTTNPTPKDVDLIAVLKPGHNFERDLLMSEYSLVSRSLLRRRFGFDVMIAERDSRLYKTYIEFFEKVRELPNSRKGLLRLSL
jgi:hypothetical protein